MVTLISIEAVSLFPSISTLWVKLFCVYMCWILPTQLHASCSPWHNSSVPCQLGNPSNNAFSCHLVGTLTSHLYAPIMFSYQWLNSTLLMKLWSQSISLRTLLYTIQIYTAMRGSGSNYGPEVTKIVLFSWEAKPLRKIAQLQSPKDHSFNPETQMKAVYICFIYVIHIFTVQWLVKRYLKQ